MKAMVVQFRRGIKHYRPRQFLLHPEKCKSKKDALKLIGKTVEWKTSGKAPKIITGKITATHGVKGLVRVLFEKGLPGQALTTYAEIKE